MTPQEHLLLLTIFAKLIKLNQVLANALTSRGVLAADDVIAFEFAANLDDPSSVAVFEKAKAMYLTCATGLGISTGLENLPPFPQGKS